MLPLSHVHSSLQNYSHTGGFSSLSSLFQSQSTTSQSNLNVALDQAFFFCLFVLGFAGVMSLDLRSQTEFLVDRIHGPIFYSNLSRSTSNTVDSLCYIYIFCFYMKCCFNTIYNRTWTFQKVRLLSHQSTEYFLKKKKPLSYKGISWQMREEPLFSLASSGFHLHNVPIDARIYPVILCDVLDETSVHSLVGRPLREGHRCFKVSPVVDNGSPSGSLESRCFCRGLVTLSWLLNWEPSWMSLDTDRCVAFSDAPAS